MSAAAGVDAREEFDHGVEYAEEEEEETSEEDLDEDEEEYDEEEDYAGEQLEDSERW